jgi:hypothetical protein
MLRYVVGLFLVLHGLVHLLYLGQSQRLFELQTGMVWPDASWIFSALLGPNATRLLASAWCAAAAVAFVGGGAAVITKQVWWRPLTLGAAAFSAVMVVLFWDGTTRKLSDQGAIALLINAVILAAVLVLRWPQFRF